MNDGGECQRMNDQHKFIYRVAPIESMDRQAMLGDPKLNDILGAIPGATVADIK